MNVKLHTKTYTCVPIKNENGALEWHVQSSDGLHVLLGSVASAEAECWALKQRGFIEKPKIATGERIDRLVENAVVRPPDNINPAITAEQFDVIMDDVAREFQVPKRMLLGPDESAEKVVNPDFLTDWGKGHAKEHLVSDKEVDDFAAVINVGGIGHLLGLAKGDDESDEDFKKRCLDRAAYKPKTKDELNEELFSFLKTHILNRICWWCVSNDGADFEIEMTESGEPWQPIITLRVYPSGKPLKAGES